MSRKRTILVVDDNIMLMKTLKSILDRKGYQVFTAVSGVEALQQLDAHEIDILLTDLRMPVMNGLELYRACKKRKPDVIAYLMSAFTSDDLVGVGLREGIRSVLTKPFDIDEMLALFSEAFECV